MLICWRKADWLYGGGERESLREKAFLRGGSLDATYCFVFHKKTIKNKSKRQPLELRSLLSINRRETPWLPWGVTVGARSVAFWAGNQWKPLARQRSGRSRLSLLPLSFTAQHHSHEHDDCLGHLCQNPPAHPAVRVHRTECVSWKESCPLLLKANSWRAYLIVDPCGAHIEDTATGQTQSLPSWSLQSSGGDWKVHGSFQCHRTQPALGNVLEGVGGGHLTQGRLPEEDDAQLDSMLNSMNNDLGGSMGTKRLHVAVLQGAWGRTAGEGERVSSG